MEKFENQTDYLSEIETLLQLSSLFGIEQSIIDSLKKYKKSAINLHSLPIEFDSFFLEHGWAATDDLSVVLMQNAIKTYKKKGLEEAEKNICQVFDDEFFELKIKIMSMALFVFKERERLIKLAYNDHKNKRFHASIPLILSQIDGVMFDYVGHSFYLKNKNLDKLRYTSPITKVEANLTPIAKKMNESRKKTNNTPLSFPYRNGILHGRDINFDNELVSTKCFFSLFALRPLALFIQNNEFSRLTGKKYVKIPSLKIGRKLEAYFSNIGLKNK